MIFAGCDLGILSAKAAIVKDGEILATQILPYKNHPKQAAQAVMDLALAKAELSMEQIDKCLATGFGRRAMPFTAESAPEKLCLQRTIMGLNSNVRTVVDVGGHNFAVFHISEDGKISESAITEKCAAGTGKFLENIAISLEMPLEALCIAAMNSTNPVPITNQCVVLAESDVISHVNEGHDRADIFAGVASYIASNIKALMRSIDIIEEVAMIGGVAKNGAVVNEVEKRLGYKLANLGDLDPQVFGAVGAALMGWEMVGEPCK